MAHDQVSTENYAAVIADLREKRAELDRAINMLEAMSHLTKPSHGVVGNHPVTEMPSSELSEALMDEVRSQSYPMGIGERCMIILRDRGIDLSTRQITDALIASGFSLTSKNPTNNVWSALSHRAKVSGDVERIGSHWRYIGSLKKHKAPQNQTHCQVNGTPTFIFKTPDEQIR